MTETQTKTAHAQELNDRIKTLIVNRLKLDVDPAFIEDSQPLFGEGLGLDSIDALELVLALEQEFGVRIEDEEVALEAMSSVTGLAAFLVDQGIDKDSSPA
jgi:acyl carrier protein